MPFFNNIKLNQGDIMKEEFRNLFGYYCAFTEDSIITSETPYKKAVIFPYGSIEKLHTFLGVSIDSYNGDGFGFAFSNMNKATKIQIKKICKTIKKNDQINSFAIFGINFFCNRKYILGIFLVQFFVKLCGRFCIHQF